MALVVGDSTHIRGFAIEAGPPSDGETLVYDSGSGTWGFTSFDSVEFALDVAQFGGILSFSDTTVQAAFDTIDDHNHDSYYALSSHNHDAHYSLLAHNHDSAYSGILHVHDGVDGEPIDYGDILNTPTSITPSAHATSHVTGADKIDSDMLELTWLPINYVPLVAVGITTGAEHLTSHLKGIDEALLSTGILHHGNHIYGMSDEVDGDRVGISWEPSSYTRTVAPGFTTHTQELVSHLNGIDLGIATHSHDGTIDTEVSFEDLIDVPSYYTPTSHGTSHHSGTIGTESQITFITSGGHSHSGVNSTVVAYSSLSGIPGSFIPSAHGSSVHSGTIGTESQITFTNSEGHNHNGTGSTAVGYSTLSGIPSTFAPSTHGSSAHSGTIGAESDVTFTNSGGHNHNGTGSTTVSYSSLGSIPSSFAPSAHASSHKNGGTDEIATATAAANAIPKADNTGKLSAAWLPAIIDLGSLAA